MLRRGVIALSVLFYAILLEPAGAESPYVFRTPVKRVALVVGNADYSTQAKLPGSLKDADLVADALQKLGFVVLKHKDVGTRAKFLHEVIDPFLAQIEPGTMAVFYFSGHGISFGGETYLTPLEFPAKVPYLQTTGTFLSVTALRDLINERSPSVTMMMLDACRSMTNVIDTTSAPAGTVQAKNLFPPANAVANTLIWFSADLGAVSYAGPSGSASFYTDALVRHMPTPDREIEYVHKRILDDVKEATSQYPVPQVPWILASYSAEIWLNPTEKTWADLERRWREVAQSGVRPLVEKFLVAYGATPFASAARRWLVEQPVNPPVAVSSISPAAPEEIWEMKVSTSTPNAASAISPSGKALDFSGSIAMPRTLDWHDISNRQANSATFASDRVGNVIAKQGRLVTRDAIQAHRLPDDAGEPVALPAGSELKVNVDDLANKKWLSVTSSKLKDRFYIRIPEAGGIGEREIGDPVLQVVVPVPTAGPQGFVDESFVVERLDEIKSGGKIVSWISIATPPATDRREKNLLSLRAAYTAYLLSKHGISADQITIVEGAADGEPNLRLRFFGR